MSGGSVRTENGRYSLPACTQAAGQRGVVPGPVSARRDKGPAKRRDSDR